MCIARVADPGHQQQLIDLLLAGASHRAILRKIDELSGKALKMNPRKRIVDAGDGYQFAVTRPGKVISLLGTLQAEVNFLARIQAEAASNAENARQTPKGPRLGRFKANGKPIDGAQGNSEVACTAGIDPAVSVRASGEPAEPKRVKAKKKISTAAQEWGPDGITKSEGPGPGSAPAMPSKTIKKTRLRRNDLAGRILRLCAVATVTSVCVADCVSAEAPCRYQITHVIRGPCDPMCGCAPLYTSGISPNGRWVCGFYHVCGFGGDTAFVYDTGTRELITLTGIAASETTPTDVNDFGIVVGYASTSTGYRGFVYDVQTGQVTYLDPLLPYAVDAYATGVNNAGFVCGYRAIGSPGDPNNPKTAFVWSAATGITDLQLITTTSSQAYDINEDNWVAVRKWNGSEMGAFLWRGNQLISLPTLVPGYIATPWALNNALDVAGASSVPHPTIPPGSPRAVFWKNGQIINLANLLPGQPNSQAYQISQQGIVAVISSTGTFLWHGGALQRFSDLVIPDPTIQGIGDLSGFSDDGRIIAGGYYLLQTHVGLILGPAVIVKGDTNADCLVNIDDLLMVINEWGETTSLADLNEDGTVNIDDLMVVLHNWTPN